MTKKGALAGQRVSGGKRLALPDTSEDKDNVGPERKHATTERTQQQKKKSAKVDKPSLTASATAEDEEMNAHHAAIYQTATKTLQAMRDAVTQLEGLLTKNKFTDPTNIAWVIEHYNRNLSTVTEHSDSAEQVAQLSLQKSGKSSPFVILYQMLTTPQLHDVEVVMELVKLCGMWNKADSEDGPMKFGNITVNVHEVVGKHHFVHNGPTPFDMAVLAKRFDIAERIVSMPVVDGGRSGVRGSWLSSLSDGQQSIVHVCASIDDVDGIRFVARHLSSTVLLNKKKQ